MILHKLPPEVIAAGWDPNGRTLLVASRDDRGERKGAKVFDASASLLREKHAPAPLPMPAPAERFAHVCRLIEEHPGEEFAWRAFAQELRQSRSSSEDTEIDTLLAAAELAMAARFSPLPDSSTPKQGALLESWRGAALPLAVQVAQACALGRWEEALTLCAAQPRSLPGASWFALAQAEAFSRLGRHAEAEASNLAAWQALRREHGASDTATRQVNTVPASPDGSGGVKLTPWANVPLSEDWTGGENNNLSSLGADRPPEGFSFVPRDFIQLAGRTFRLNPHGRMLARSIGWLPTSRPANRLSFLVGACYVDSSESLQDMCIGSLFLLREGGSGAARVPLLYGRNVWDWWLPAAGGVQQPTPEVMAWAGQNPNAQFRNHSLGLYRVDWESVPSAEKAAQRPIVAISFVSHLRQPAPMLLAAEAQETKTETAER
jgi:hypothetical protein